MKQGEAVHQFEIVADVLSETKAGIDQDPVALDPRGRSRLDPLFQPCVDLDQNIIIAWIVLHGLRRALMVHQYDRRSTCGDRASRPIVVS